MLRFLILALALTSLLAVACGGGDDDDDNNGDGSEGDSTAVDTGPRATPTPKLLPTPPSAADDEEILTVSAGETAFKPTLQEFRDLPKVTIDAGGEREGVSLAEIASRVSAPEGALVNLQGYRGDGRMYQFIREPVSEIGEDSVLVLDEAGRLSFYSSKLDESQWLVNVTVVSFQ